MKFGLILSLVAGLLLSVSWSSDKRKSFDDVLEYNDFIIDHINALDSVYVLTLATDNGIDVCMRKCDVLVDLCDKTTADFKGIQPYKGDSTLTMQALIYTQFMKNNGQTEVKKLLKLIEKYDNASLEEQEAMEKEVQAAADKIDDQYDMQIDNIDKVQQKFSKKFNFTIMK